MIKSIYKVLPANIALNGERLNVSTWDQWRGKNTHLTTSSQLCTGHLCAIRQKKDKKGIQIEKEEIKLSLFTGHIFM